MDCLTELKIAKPTIPKMKNQHHTTEWDEDNKFIIWRENDIMKKRLNFWQHLMNKIGII